MLLKILLHVPLAEQVVARTPLALDGAANRTIEVSQDDARLNSVIISLQLLE